MEGLSFSSPDIFGQTLTVLLIFLSIVGIAGGIFIASKNALRGEKRKRDMHSNDFE